MKEIARNPRQLIVDRFLHSIESTLVRVNETLRNSSLCPVGEDFKTGLPVKFCSKAMSYQTTASYWKKQRLVIGSPCRRSNRQILRIFLRYALEARHEVQFRSVIPREYIAYRRTRLPQTHTPRKSLLTDATEARKKCSCG